MWPNLVPANTHMKKKYIYSMLHCESPWFLLIGWLFWHSYLYCVYVYAKTQWQCKQLQKPPRWEVTERSRQDLWKDSDYETMIHSCKTEWETKRWISALLLLTVYKTKELKFHHWFSQDKTKNHFYFEQIAVQYRLIFSPMYFYWFLSDSRL